MNSFVLSQTDYLVFPLIASVLFVSIFTLMLMWVFRPGARAVHRQRAHLVFDRNDAAEGASDE